MSMLESTIYESDDNLSGSCVPCKVSDFSLAAFAALFLVACIGTVALDAVLTIAPPPIHGFTSQVP
ncbi:hypothetical protein SAMN05444581_11613 [Methylocapsa palsarum]|uniref:Uncharacterized protein n=1 Tax=Methylocapsa palsarum TaxID=1612308 RepID=A0A1I4BSH1_9HYPH|nr:hypothetical protein SAMN05444581_11613 [Methylocapsa palsarum]